MPTTRLTDASAQRLKAKPGERIEYFDRLLPGFGLRVSGPTGHRRNAHKAWFVFYRVHGRLRRFTINSYPALSLKDARDQAREALRAAKCGEDPAAIRRAERHRVPDTVEAIVDDFMKRHMEGKRRSESYIAGTRGIFDNHVLPRWRGRDIRTITRRDVIELLDGITDRGKRKNGRRTGGPIAANRALAAVSRLFTWALQRGIVEATPAAIVERPGEETRRERTLSANEISEMWPLLERASGPSEGADHPPATKRETEPGYPFGHYFKMVLATGQRRDEVATMRWQDVDEAERIWTLPSERTKAGRAHVVPLSPLALEIVAACRRALVATWEKPGSHVFSVTNDGPITGSSKARARLEKAIAAERAKRRAERAGQAAGAEPQSERWTIHDLRRTVATGLGRLGTSRLVIGRILNHADRSVTGIYDRHEYLAEKRHALEAWCSYLGSLTAPPDDKVVSIAVRG